MDEADFRVIDLAMVRPELFLPLSGAASFAVNGLLYPLALIRTRLVMQQRTELYRGVFHGARQIVAAEGVAGLYNGFLVKSTQLFSGMAYVATYESVRLKLADFNLHPSLRSFIAGGLASAIGQTLVVPVDVVSQHLMILNNKDKNVGSLSSIRLSTADLKTPLTRFIGVCKYILHNYGIGGFYKGYIISMLTFVPNSALWWGFYNTYCDNLSSITSTVDPPRLLIQIISAPLAGTSSALIMNPVDCVRLRLQVKNERLLETVKRLWKEERWYLFRKGLSARLIMSITYSFWIILFYEPIKYFSLKEEYKDNIKI